VRTPHLVVIAAFFVVAAAPHAFGDEPEAEIIAGKKLAPDAASRVLYADFVPRRHLSGPWIHSTMPECLCRKIEAALEIATQRLRDIPECADLFAPFGADGLDLLAGTL
jgi:hypothetical protein